MKKAKIRKIIIASLIVVIIIVSVLVLVFGTRKTTTAFTKVLIPEGSDVTVYVSGNGVIKNADGSYSVTNPQSEITITVVNENKLFSSMTISDGNSLNITTDRPIHKMTVSDIANLSIDVTTDTPFAGDIGKYFGNPFILNKEADVLAVARLLEKNNETKDADLALIGASDKSFDDIRYGYFRLGTNLFLSDESFYGLGKRGKSPFGGCFDFDGYSVTINLTRTEHITSEFVKSGNEYIADYGFFSYVYGDGENPCLIRNAKVQGFIGINTMSETVTTNRKDRVNAGGIAGTLGKNVVLDNIESTVSVSGQTKYATLYMGGVFGLCSSSVQNWCHVLYDGVYNDVSSVTYGGYANAYAGAFAGVVHNASVDGVIIDGERSMILANSLGSISGSAVAGGFVGVLDLAKSSSVEISDPQPMFINDVVVYAEHDYSITSVIDNSGSSSKDQINPDNFSVNSAGSVSGGIIGVIYRDVSTTEPLSDDCLIEMSNIYFLRSRSSIAGGEPLLSKSRISINASTLDGDSSGSTFAGGMVGYIYSISSKYVLRDVPQDTIKRLFECSVDISSVQNGIGPAYAGGVFGYNSIEIKGKSAGNLEIAIVPTDCDYTVTAIQSSTSKRVNDLTFYNVCAGGYSARLNIGYSIDNLVFHVCNGRVSALREVGSTAIGDVNAGGFAGRVFGCGTESTKIKDYDAIVSKEVGSNGSGPLVSNSGQIENVTVYFSNKTRVEASCYSYDSRNDRDNTQLGNNVCAGGAIGYALGISLFNNIQVKYEYFNTVGETSEYFVCGTQNASNGGMDNDLKTEGYVGGVFGLLIDSKVENVKFEGDSSENSVVYFSSTNSPNTASVGGLIGATWRRYNNKYEGGATKEVALVNEASIKYAHVAGKAYCEQNNVQERYDIYVGGAIGVLAVPNDVLSNIASTFTSVKNVTVDSCVIDAIGEKTMLPYAGGIVAGMWWNNTTELEYGIVTNSSITSSSIEPNAYAGGIAGLIQKSNVSSCLVQNTDVKAISANSSAYCGGITARGKDKGNINSCYSNASLTASGTKINKFGIIAFKNSISLGSGTNINYINYFVYETAGTDQAYDGDTGKNNAIYLTKPSTGIVNHATLSNNDAPLSVYPKISYYSDSPISVESHASDIATVGTSNNIYKVTPSATNSGIAYISVYCQLKSVKYLLCSYPITVGSVTESGSIKLVDGESAMDVTEQNSDGYIEYTHGTGSSAQQYIYYRRNIGNPDTVKSVKLVPIVPEGAEVVLPRDVKLYDISVPKAEYFTADNTNQQILDRVNAIINNKPRSSCGVSTFNGRVNVGFEYVSGGNNEGDAKKAIFFYANDNVRDNTVILVECNFGGTIYSAIIEFVPNKLTGITITPESGTPPLGTSVDTNDITHYVYIAGDVVRFSAELFYRYPAPKSYVVETKYSGKGVTENGLVSVQTGGVYTVTCKALNDDNVSTTVIVEARKEVAFSFSYLGAIGSSDRKMVESCAFNFAIQPQPGYGLLPVIKLDIGGTEYLAEFVNDCICVTIGDTIYQFDYVADEITDYSYDITASTDFLQYLSDNNLPVKFLITYSKTCTLVFIDIYSDENPYGLKVATGEYFKDIDLSGVNEYNNSIAGARYGYDYKGLYTVSNAGDVSAYGKSFEDMCADDRAIICGTMRFYARWTYNIKVEKPENINVVSSLPGSMLYASGSLVPLDAGADFGFIISTDDNYCGTPRYSAFSRDVNGKYIDITADFAPTNQQNGYMIKAERILELGSGFIYVKIYSDSLDFAVGDDLKYDGNALYTDGIFTVTYNVNYGVSDLPTSFAFDFAELPLPVDTSLRLFYIKNGSGAWSGSSLLNVTKNQITLADFASVVDGTAFNSSVRNGAKNEKFVMIVTLPYNTNKFGITDATDFEITVDSYDYVKTYGVYGDFSGTVTDMPDTTTNKSECDYVLHPAVIMAFTANGNTLTFSQSGSYNESVVDHRHNGSRYMWRIEKTSGGNIGNADTVAFVGLGDEVVRTTHAIYYFATVGDVTVIGDLSGYTLSLVEVKNVQQPGVSLVVGEIAFN